MEELNSSIKNYYDTLTKTGYVNNNYLRNLLVLDFVMSLFCDPDYLLFTTVEEQGIVNKLYTFVTENNSLLC